jgi:hypothetical protein
VSGARVYRCPRCLAEDISSDAHPTRVLQGEAVAPAFVCRNCFRAAELAFRIACETQGIPYAPLPIREGLRRLLAFYRERLDAQRDPAALLEEAERASAEAPLRRALAEVERRLAIERVD